MGNTNVKPHPLLRNKKQVHWKAAARPHPPGKPHLISEVERIPDLITICWSKPVSDGGSPISGYIVEHRRTGSPHWVRSSPIVVTNTETTVSGLEPGWRYQFRVSAQNAVGFSDPSDLSEPITVTLQRSAITSPRFTQGVQETTASENERIEFVVHILGQPSPKVCWFKDDFEIFSSRRIRIATENGKSVLTIHQCSLSDEGEIKCTATNRAGHVSSHARLTIVAPPSIRLPRQYEEGLLFDIGELIRLKASVAGQPTPLVLWSHNGESIKNNDRYEIEHVDKTSILKINEAQRCDRGEYHVKAVNKLGEDVQSFLVTITDKPSPPGRAQVVMALGRSVTLSWTSPQDDGGSRIGNYIVEYYRVGWNVWLKAANSRQATTILGDLIEGSEYKFRVKAESPHGISEPSEESEIVFIPDIKRGILQPPTRGRSQPIEVNQKIITPIARRKYKKRSSSSSRVDISNQPSPLEAPKRPERSKLKSPSKTPEVSPFVARREVDKQVNRNIFESSNTSFTGKDAIYGSPEVGCKKESSSSSTLKSQQCSGSEKSRSSSPILRPPTDHNRCDNLKIELPSQNNVLMKSKSSSPEIRILKPPQEDNDKINGSSEFMLVLYPSENDLGKFDFDFNMDSIPPPMSLSAPELGAECPVTNNLRKSVSSTEILHERAMIRLYEDVQVDDEKRRQNIGNENPKQKITSRDDQKFVGFDTKPPSARRLSTGVVEQQQDLWAKRRHSLLSPKELKDEVIPGEKLKRFPVRMDMKKQKSRYEEMENIALDANWGQVDGTSKTVIDKPKVNVTDLEKLAEDYESSTDDTESSEESGEEQNVEEQISDKEPFEILTRKKEPPSPDFIPKPILKKAEHELNLTNTTPLSSPTGPQRSRSHSITLTRPVLQIPTTPAETVTPRRRSFSLIPQKELLPNRVHERPLVLEKSTDALMPSISAVATISGITVASIVIPDKLLERRNVAEDAKVVIDHYSDIVKKYGGRRGSNSPTQTAEDTTSKLSGRQSASVHDYGQFEETKPRSLSKSPPRRFLEGADRENGPVTGKTYPLSETVERRRRTSPVRGRRSAESPMKNTTADDESSTRNASKGIQKTSPASLRLPAEVQPSAIKIPNTPSPVFREIMTQTSEELYCFESDSGTTSESAQRQKELRSAAQVKVHGFVDYVTDLAMFAVACWLYILGNELLVIPVLFVMIYRQLRAELMKWIPMWLLRRLTRGNKK